MVTFVAGLVAAFLFMMKFADSHWHDLLFLGLFFLAIAVAFIGVWPWTWRRPGQ